ncbi:MAG TPA: ABC transporter ATP-binding protein [Stellaceae bacterium]|nr:ABC transporter ATP-binding protein [Stellaceae bacterium]
MNALALEVAGLSLRLGACCLRDVDLAAAGGEILVLLGPNGAGKSVFLETIAGFYRPDAGRIAIGGRDVTELPPEERRVGFLVQNFGLFPHRTVAQNVALGARSRQDESQVAALLRRFDIAHLAERRPLLLSPGEKQRAALARALASRPDLFLFDEPFAALDAQTHEALRDELALFLRQSGIPAVFVTHDHGDALALGDRLAVMAAGTIVQRGAAGEVFARPASRSVAHFLGVENILDGRIVANGGDGLLRVEVGSSVLSCRSPAPAQNGKVALAIRAGDVRLNGAAAPKANGADNVLAGRITALRTIGPLCKLTIDCGFPLTAYLLAREAQGLAPEARLDAAIAVEAVHVLPGGES